MSFISICLKYGDITLYTFTSANKVKIYYLRHRTSLVAITEATTSLLCSEKNLSLHLSPRSYISSTVEHTWGAIKRVINSSMDYSLSMFVVTRCSWEHRNHKSVRLLYRSNRVNYFYLLRFQLQVECQISVLNWISDKILKHIVLMFKKKKDTF